MGGSGLLKILTGSGIVGLNILPFSKGGDHRITGPLFFLYGRNPFLPWHNVTRP